MKAVVIQRLEYWAGIRETQVQMLLRLHVALGHHVLSTCPALQGSSENGMEKNQMLLGTVLPRT